MGHSLDQHDVRPDLNEQGEVGEAAHLAQRSGELAIAEGSPVGPAELAYSNLPIPPRVFLSPSPRPPRPRPSPLPDRFDLLLHGDRQGYRVLDRTCDIVP